MKTIDLKYGILSKIYMKTTFAFLSRHEKKMINTFKNVKK